MFEILSLICAFVFGGIVVYFIFYRVNSSKITSILEEANSQAEQIKKEKILQAKEKFIELKSEHEKVINKRNNDINNAHQRVKQKETILNQKLAEVNKKDTIIKKIEYDLNQRKIILEKKTVRIR